MSNLLQCGCLQAVRIPAKKASDWLTNPECRYLRFLWVPGTCQQHLGSDPGPHEEGNRPLHCLSGSWQAFGSLAQSLTTYSGVLQGLGGPYKMHQGEAVRPSTSTFGTFSAKPVKSLGPWYHTFLNTTEQVDQLKNDAVSGLKSIHKTSLPGTFKLWSMQCWLLSHHVAISLTVNLPSQR